MEYLLSLMEQGVSVETLKTQYGVGSSTLYHWLSRYQTYHTYENRSSAPHQICRKVTELVKAAVLKKHQEYPRLGCWRLSLFEYEGIRLGPTTIWQILVEARSPKLPAQLLYHLTHAHQIWFIDHMHIRTLPDGQKVYSLIVLDGFSRVLLSDEICLTKGARDACLILLSAFARWGLPQQILSDNAKAFTSLLYRLLLGVLRVKVRYSHPGCPWENPFAESFIGTLRAYFYPHIQRQKSVSGVERIYDEKTDYYNHRVHWAFRRDEVKTPLAKLGAQKGRALPEAFELSLPATGRRFTRLVDRQGRISFKRYRLQVRVELAHQRVELREFFDSLVVTYRSGAVVSYECIHQRREIESIQNTPVFHEHGEILDSPQLELFDLSEYQLRYVSQSPPYRRTRYQLDATQLVILEIEAPKQKG